MIHKSSKKIKPALVRESSSSSSDEAHKKKIVSGVFLLTNLLECLTSLKRLRPSNAIVKIIGSVVTCIKIKLLYLKNGIPGLICL